jgi:predicted house-cleaning noncanonical NTP pyrophosphatase (MazG superfamily)
VSLLQETLQEDYKTLFSKKNLLEEECNMLSSKKKQLLAEVGILDDTSSMYAIKDNLMEQVRTHVKIHISYH